MEEQNHNKVKEEQGTAREHGTFVKECLKTALLALMREKSYKELSVSELCRKAGVSRMGFYRHYQVIDDLFRETARDLNGKILDALGSPFRKGTSEQWYLEAFRIIEAHREDLSGKFSVRVDEGRERARRARPLLFGGKEISAPDLVRRF